MLRIEYIFKKLGIFAVVVIIFAAICVNVGHANDRDNNLVFIGRIESISTLPDKPRFNPWVVKIKVVSITNPDEKMIKIGDQVVLNLHGIVRIFGGLTKDIVGKKYRLTLLDTFNPIYSGRIIASPVDDISD